MRFDAGGLVWEQLWQTDTDHVEYQAWPQVWECIQDVVEERIWTQVGEVTWRMIFLRLERGF